MRLRLHRAAVWFSYSTLTTLHLLLKPIGTVPTCVTMSFSPPDGKLPISRSFFKVMMPGFLTKLCLPPAFCREMDGVKLEDAVLTSRKGSLKVKISRCNKGYICFEEGWENFVQQHDINLGDFVVFDHKDPMHFDVSVFDTSACEKEFPQNFDHHLKRKSSALNIHEHVKHIKRERPSEAATSQSPHTSHFITTIKEWNGRPDSPYMNIPADFIRSNDLSKLSSISLRGPSGKLWTVELRSRNDRKALRYRPTRMVGGWYEFYKSNKLKEGDVCMFELNGTLRRSKSVVMDVRIFPSPNPNFANPSSN